jgi:hypothetical protein
MDTRGLPAAELDAVIALWRRTQRPLEARFTGSSMEPAIPSGSTLRLLCGAPLQVGQVAAFVRDGHVIVHRLVARHASSWLARGDALTIPDPPLPLETPFARAVAVLQGGSWIETPAHPASLLQRAVLAPCAWTHRLSVRGARLLIASLRRLRPRAAAAVEVLE